MRTRLYILLIVSCWFLASCTTSYPVPADTAMSHALDKYLLALHVGNAHEVVAFALYPDTKGGYRKGTAEDVDDADTFLQRSPQLWNYKNYQVLHSTTSWAYPNPKGRADVLLTFPDGSSVIRRFYFVYMEDKWWVTQVLDK